MSLSRRAGSPHSGHLTFMNSGTFSSGERPLPVIGNTERQHHRQIFFGHRDDAAFRAINHGDRRAPIALARDAPILDAKCDGGFSETFRFGFGGHDAARFVAGESGVRAGLFDDAIVGKRFFHGGGIGQSAVDGTDNRADGDAVLLAELEVALVVRGNGHDGAGAVAHQHEVADPDGELLAAIRIDGVACR